jgi:hypothetical protein
MVEPIGIRIPATLESGKFGTPCERMQSVNLISCAAALEPPALCDALEDPQAVIATADAITASTLTELWRWPLGGSVFRD